MGKEQIVIDLATAKVLQEETSYMNALRRQHNKQVGKNEDGAEATLEEMIKEAQRLNHDRHIADEEEAILYNLERNEKKHG